MDRERNCWLPSLSNIKNLNEKLSRITNRKIDWHGTSSIDFVHIDHKGTLNPTSNGKHHCLKIVYSFSRFIQVDQVRSANAVDKIQALEKFSLGFGIARKLVYDKCSEYLNQDFKSYIHELNITPRTAFSPWTNGKLEVQKKHLSAQFRIFLDRAQSRWNELAPKLEFAKILYKTQAQVFLPIRLYLEQFHFL